MYIFLAKRLFWAWLSVESKAWSLDRLRTRGTAHFILFLRCKKPPRNAASQIKPLQVAHVAAIVLYWVIGCQKARHVLSYLIFKNDHANQSTTKSQSWALCHAGPKAYRHTQHPSCTEKDGNKMEGLDCIERIPFNWQLLWIVLCTQQLAYPRARRIDPEAFPPEQLKQIC